MKQHYLHIEGGGFKPQVAANPDDTEFVIIDLFCGAGGTTTGFNMAEIDGKKIALVAACVNHDWKAIKSHWQNHPDVVHFEEDIRTLELTGLRELVMKYRLLYPNAKIILWASLECTNFSKAKGGQPRDADSRTLADHLDRYIIALDPDYVQIENVVEFMSWGPLDTNGKPVSRKSGSNWLRWRKHICSLGYHDEWKEMNSADFGAYTSRNRLFGCFAKIGLPIAWPVSTHAKKASGTLFSQQEKWKPVKDVLDFSDEGESIFTRKKELSPKTLERIYAGLIKYVAGGKEAFMIRYNSVSAKGSYKQTAVDIENPCPVVSTQNRLGMCFIAKHFSGRPEGKVIPVTGPAGTITTFANQSLVQPKFLTKYYSGNPENMIGSVNEPASTLRTKDGNGLVQCYLFKYYGNGSNISSQDEPAGTLTTKSRMAKVWLDKNYSGKHNHQSIDQPAGSLTTHDKLATIQTSWIDRPFSGGGQHSSIEGPAGSMLGVPKLNLVNTESFILNTSYGNKGSSINQPAPPLLASRRHHYIVNPSHGGHSTSIEAPCPVIIARQDKAPLYLIGIEQADVAIPVYEDDPDVMVNIKVFMALYGISDIKMRMLKVPELLKIQGFPDDYSLYGNQSDQKKFIGNSVVPHVVKAWCEALGSRLRAERIAA